MKHIGTIEINCGEKTCDKCKMLVTLGNSIVFCTCFYAWQVNNTRCQQCLATFKIKENKE